MALIILSIGLLVFLGHFLTGLFKRSKVPDVLLLMLGGILLGPVTHVVKPEDFGKVGPVFTTLALIIILFEGGIHLSVRELGNAARDTLLIALSTFAVTVLVITNIAELLLPIDALTALLIGTILGGTSSAVVVPLLGAIDVGNRPRTVLILESALTDVLAVVLSLGIMDAMSPGLAVGAGSLVWSVLRSFLVAALIGFLGAFIWSALLDKIREFPNTIFSTIAYVLILFGITELTGYSGAIAAMTFGIAVANFPSIPERLIGRVINFRLVGFHEVEREFFAETVFLVKTFFFVYLGIAISFSNLQAVAVGLGLALLAYVGRAVMVRLVADRAYTRREALLTTALIPKGLAAAVLASLPAQRGIEGGELIQGTVYSVIFFSILVTAIFVFAIERGQLERVGSILFRPFAVKPPEHDSGPFKGPSTSALTLGLPAMPVDVYEPNPVVFGDAEQDGPVTPASGASDRKPTTPEQRDGDPPSTIP